MAACQLSLGAGCRGIPLVVGAWLAVDMSMGSGVKFLWQWFSPSTSVLYMVPLAAGVISGEVGPLSPEPLLVRVGASACSVAAQSTAASTRALVAAAHVLSGKVVWKLECWCQCCPGSASALCHRALMLAALHQRVSSRSELCLNQGHHLCRLLKPWRFGVTPVPLQGLWAVPEAILALANAVPPMCMQFYPSSAVAPAAS